MGIDYADWLTPERLLIEEAAWAKDKFHERYVAAALKRAGHVELWRDDDPTEPMIATQRQ